MSETFVLDTVARFVGGTEDAELRISNAGTGTVYYDNERTVSSSSNDGSIASGASATRRDPTWIVATTQTPVTITRVEHAQDSHNVHGFEGDFADVAVTQEAPINVQHSTYGAVGDGSTDDTVAIQAAITAAFNAPGGEVVVPDASYKITAPLVTPANTAGAIKITGIGRTRAFSGGVAGDPAAAQGAHLLYTGDTGSLFHAVASSGSVRQYITLENLSLFGNKASGASGHGIHFESAASTSAILFTLRDVTVTDFKQHGVFANGNVFESQLYNVRLDQNADRGFKAVLNTGGIPGETRFYGVTCSSNGVGVDLSGGGTFSVHGLSSSSNTNQGLIVNGANMTASDLVLETNGGAAGNQAEFTGAHGAILDGVVMTVTPSATGIGLKFLTCFFAHVNGFKPNSSAGGVGWKDFVFDNDSRACSMEDYITDDFTDRYTLGTLGGHAVKRGDQWLTKQSRAVSSLTGAGGVSVAPDARIANDFIVTATGATLTIANPLRDTGYHDGQAITIELYNNSGGALTTTWEPDFTFLSTWADPANAARRTVTFHWNNTATKWMEVSRGVVSHAPGDLEIDGAINHDGTTVGFFGTAPATQHADITDASVAHALNATFSDTEAEAALDALGVKVNLILDVLDRYGLTA